MQYKSNRFACQNKMSYTISCMKTEHLFLLLIIFFSYGYLSDILYMINIQGKLFVFEDRFETDNYLIIITGVLFLTALFIILKCSKKIDIMNNYLNVLALVLIFFPLINICYYEIAIRSKNEEMMKL